jgi:hypothetical protein
MEVLERIEQGQEIGWALAEGQERIEGRIPPATF